MKYLELLCRLMICSSFLVAFGCGSGSDVSNEVVDKVCYTSDGQYEPSGTICDDGLCYNGTHAGMCDGIGNCVVTEQASYTGNCLVFLSSGRYDGDLGGLAGADQICQDLAEEQGLTGIFRAWLSDSNTTAGQRLTHSKVPYVNVWGQKIADNWQDLTDGTLQIPILTDQKGFSHQLGCLLGVGMVWTDTSFRGGTRDGPNCRDWTENRNPEEGGAQGLVGHYCFDNRAWTDPTGVIAMPGCKHQKSLYCFQQ